MSFVFVMFQTLIALSLIAWIVALVATTRFIARHKAASQSLLSPIQGTALWLRFLSRDGFGTAVEEERRRILKMYVLALMLFVFAVAVFVVGGVGA